MNSDTFFSLNLYSFCFIVLLEDYNTPAKQGTLTVASTDTKLEEKDESKWEEDRILPYNDPIEVQIGSTVTIGITQDESDIKQSDSACSSTSSIECVLGRLYARTQGLRLSTSASNNEDENEEDVIGKDDIQQSLSRIAARAMKSNPNKFDFNNLTGSSNNTQYRGSYSSSNIRVEMSGSVSRTTYSSKTSYTLPDDRSEEHTSEPPVTQ